MFPFPRLALRSALVACASVAAAGIVAGAVRVLPWLLDPAVPLAVAAPFARGLAAVALEAAVVVGWPLGWALAAFRVVESGEARVLATLGERPERTIARLSSQAALFAVALAASSLVYGGDASAPGRVATELITQGRASCLAARQPTAYAIPFTDMTWLCAPGEEPRLVGTGPGAMSRAFLTARTASIAGDFRALELVDARLFLPTEPPLSIRVASLSIHGMSPWARASILPPWLRAFLLVLSGGGIAAISATLVLRGCARGRFAAGAFAAVGSVAALGMLRALESRADALTGVRSAAAFVLVPVVGIVSCVVASRVSGILETRGSRG